MLWGLLWAKFTSPLYLVTCTWKYPYMDAYRSHLACVWYGWFFYRFVCSRLWAGNGALVAVVQTTKVQSSSSPGSVRCRAGASEPCGGSDSKSVPRNYFVSWSELMICVWLLSSRTTQLCNRVFGSFYGLDQGLGIILCLWKDFWPFLFIASFPQFWNTDTR